MTARRLGALAVLLYVAAWCVPVIEMRGDLLNGRAWGWQAFLYAMSPLFGNDMGAHPLQIVWMVSSALTNFLLLVTVWLLFWRAQRLKSALAWSLAGAVLANAGWMALATPLRDLRIGYYLWLGAFFVMATAAFLHVHHRTAQAGDGAAAD